MDYHARYVTYFVWWFQKTNSKSHGPHVLETTLAHHKKWRPNGEYQCDASQIPSEGQVRISHNSWVSESG